jgi:NAD(P)H dehydrogenase (quinone)
MRSFLETAFTKLNNFSSYVQPLSNRATKLRKVLLIRAHPVAESFSAALADATERGLRSAGHEVRVRSLYHHPGSNLQCYAGSTFPAALSADERRGYMNAALIKERETGASNLSVEIIEAVSDLRWCDSAVFVFPTWWFSLPAVLKGYFDRVLLPGIAFLLPDASLKGAGGTGLISGLTNITKLGVVTTYGTPFHVVLYCGDSSRSIISNAVRPICAPDCPLIWSGLYDMDHTSQTERETFLASVENKYKEF